MQEAFTAFGRRRHEATWQDCCLRDDLSKIKSVSRRGYTGHEAIGGVSKVLNHMNGRVQDAITGRFLSADPYGVTPGKTQSFNRYDYVMNNPMSFTDPSGFYATSACDSWALFNCDVNTMDDPFGFNHHGTYAGALPGLDEFTVIGSRLPSVSSDDYKFQTIGFTVVAIVAVKVVMRAVAAEMQKGVLRMMRRTKSTLV